MDFKKKTFFLLFWLFASLTSTGFGLETIPWGKDAELAFASDLLVKGNDSSAKCGGAEYIIRFHHQVITHADGPRSHYLPSSSTYMFQAIKQHGFFQGFIIGCDRMMRENDAVWHYPLIKTIDGHFLKSDQVPFPQKTSRFEFSFQK